MFALNSLLAISWQPGLRGISVVLISFVVLCGSVYLLLATNVGARLGMMLSLAGLFGWMFLMGIIWISYGIGLQGAGPSWQARDTIVGQAKLTESQLPVIRDQSIPDNKTPGARVNGWKLLPEDDGGRGQAIAAADEILTVQSGGLKVGEYIPVAVFDKGGERWPNVSFDFWKFGTVNLDYIAFFHKPHYALVEVAPVIKQKAEPGKAPPKAIADPNSPHWYVAMERDRGSKRRPAGLITVGSGLLFGLLCYKLHKRDQLVELNRSAKPEPVNV
jgi:hypothetical protein